MGGVRGATFQEKVQELFVHRHWTVACAESCTSGRLAAALTENPGASSYFLGGVVSYSNQAKVEILGVPGAMIEKHGAVSLPVVQRMALGVRNCFGSDWAVSVSGVAGPDGGSEERPVGTVCFAVVGPGVEWQGREFFANDGRLSVMNRSVDFALKTLWNLVRD